MKLVKFKSTSDTLHILPLASCSYRSHEGTHIIDFLGASDASSQGSVYVNIPPEKWINGICFLLSCQSGLHDADTGEHFLGER
jgi:hypothetical protein